jgi:Sugar transferases involved in lipopolysaccharide synthesis
MISDLASRAGSPPPNPSSRLFKKLALVDLSACAFTVLFSYMIALFYVAARSGANFADIFDPYGSIPRLHVYCRLFPALFCEFFALHTLVEWLMGKFAQRKSFTRYNVAFGAAVSGAALMIVVWFMSWLGETRHMRGFFATMAVAYFPVSITLHALIDTIIAKLFAKRILKKANTLLVGSGPLADRAWDLSKTGRLGAYTIAKRAAPPKEPADARLWLRERLQETPAIDAVFLFAPTLSREATMELAVEAVLSGKYCKATAPECGDPALLGADRFGSARVMHLNCLCDATASDFARRAFSRTLAVLMAVPAFFLHFTLAAIIRLDSPGDIMFKQRRFGLLGKEFTMFKYRTMTQDADLKKDSLRHLNENDGGLFKIKHDPRVTKAGRWLRKSSLDEVPQLLNILRGEMQFVGPRPLPCRDLDGYDDRWQSARFFARPGITGVWQISGRSNVKFDGMCELDIWYSLNRSVRLDFIILARTIGAVAFGVGAH